MATFTSATTFLIENAPRLFNIPDRLEDEVQLFAFARGGESRRSLAFKSKEGGPGVACLVANTVFSFVEKPDVDEDGEEEDTDDYVTVCDNLEGTVNSQLDLNLNILNIVK